MRHFLISALLLSLLAGCSGYRIGPHRIDVQQGNALDQDNVARLKLGLSHSQVRFLLGTPLLVDPFHNDRWDYVYVYYKAGKLAEQRHISLFFDGDTLARIEGDMPSADLVAQAQAPAAAPTAAGKPESQTATTAAPVAADANKNPAVQAGPAAAPAAMAAPAVATAEAETEAVPAATPPAAPVPQPTAAAAASPVAETASAPAVAPAASTKKPAAAPKHLKGSAATSVVQPLPSAKDAPPYKDPHPSPELSLQAETEVAQIKPDVIPPFPESAPVAAENDDAVLKALNAWASAWSRRDSEAYFAAYDAAFIPQGGGSHADWVKRRRTLLEVARNIDVKIESPSVDRVENGIVTVTFNQFYRSDNYRDAVVKQFRMIERDGRWLIIDEKVLSVLHKAKP